MQSAVIFIPTLTLTLYQKSWGRCEKNLPKEEGKVEKKSMRSVPLGQGLKPGTYRVAGESQQLHATAIVLTSLSMTIDRLGGWVIVQSPGVACLEIVFVRFLGVSVNQKLPYYTVAVQVILHYR